MAKKKPALTVEQPTSGANYFTAKGTNEDGVEITISSVSLHGLRSAAVDNGFKADDVDFGDLTDGGLTELVDAEAEAANEGDTDSSGEAASTGNASTGGRTASGTASTTKGAGVRASTT